MRFVDLITFFPRLFYAAWIWLWWSLFSGRDSALVYAAKKGWAGTVGRLLAAPWLNKTKRTALLNHALIAIGAGGNTAMLTALLGKLTDLKLPSQTLMEALKYHDKGGQSLVIKISNNGSVPMMEALLIVARASFNKTERFDLLGIVDGSENTALITAAYHGHEALIRKLLEEMNDIQVNNTDLLALLTQKNQKNQMAWMAAAVNGHVETMEVLLEAMGKAGVTDTDLLEMLKMTDDNTYTVLNSIVYHGHVDTMKALWTQIEHRVLPIENRLEMIQSAKKIAEDQLSQLQSVDPQDPLVGSQIINMANMLCEINCKETSIKNVITENANKIREALENAKVARVAQARAVLAREAADKAAEVAEAEVEAAEAAKQAREARINALHKRILFYELDTIDLIRFASGGHMALIQEICNEMDAIHASKEEKMWLLNTVDNYGYTALMRAALNGHDEIIKVLIKFMSDAGATEEDIIKALTQTTYESVILPNPWITCIVGNGGGVPQMKSTGYPAYSPLLLAASKNHIETIDLILAEMSKAKASPEQIADAFESEIDGSTVLTWAGFNVNQGMMDRILKEMEAVKIIREDQLTGLNSVLIQVLKKQDRKFLEKEPAQALNTMIEAILQHMKRLGETKENCLSALRAGEILSDYLVEQRIKHGKTYVNNIFNTQSSLGKKILDRCQKVILNGKNRFSSRASQVSVAETRESENLIENGMSNRSEKPDVLIPDLILDLMPVSDPILSNFILARDAAFSRKKIRLPRTPDQKAAENISPGLMKLISCTGGENRNNISPRRLTFKD